MFENLQEAFLILVVFLFLFFSFFLFAYKEGRQVIRKILGLFFFALALSICDIYLLQNGFYEQNPQFAFILNTILFLYGPITWLLTKSVTVRAYRPNPKDLVHFVPFFLVLGTMIVTYHTRNAEFKQEFFARASNARDFTTLTSSLIFFFYTGIYIVKSFRQVRRYREEMKEQVSNVENLKLEWLKYILWWFLAIMLAALVVQVTNIIAGEERNIPQLLLGFLLLAMFLFILSAILKGLRKTVAFSETVLSPGSIKTKEVDSGKLDELLALMKSKKPFLSPNLTLKDLATAFGQTPRFTSGLINNGTQQSFFDFINSYRIEHFMQVMRESTDQHLTILEVMYASGFNSKSSFNTAFKKKSGKTPSQWRKTIVA